MESFGHQSGADPHALPQPLLREQRRGIRHKVHTPAYASLQQLSTDTVLDLCEILDISERGALLQTPMGWQLGTALDLMLDFSETQTKLHTRGEVVWSDAGGRVGVRFPDLTEEARHQLKQWLFLNVMVAAANHAAGIDSIAAQRALPPAPLLEQLPPPLPLELIEDRNEPILSDYTTTLAALGVVQREVESLGSDLEAALELIGHRGRGFTQASGSAIGIADASGMICRASSGDAPPVGTILEIGSGLSGRCVQTGLLQRCDDAERDLRVDRESCRLLNVRSILAVPVRRGDRVLGLMEVFSPRAYAFGELEASVLQRFSETILAVLHRAGHAGQGLAPTVSPATRPSSPPRPRATPEVTPPVSTVLFAAPLEAPEPPEMNFLRRHLTVLVAFAALVLAALAYVLVPSLVHQSRLSSRATPVASAASAQPVTTPPSLPQIRERAEQGDANSQYTLGTRYALGEDVEQDYPTAAQWFLKAAEQGLVAAQDILGSYYWAGRGVPKNLTEAYYWSALAELGGSPASRQRVGFLAQQLTPEQAHSIERSAGEFFRQHPPQEKKDVR